jgi:c-di-GMP-binding flagellar brake protein YcgR
MTEERRKYKRLNRQVEVRWRKNFDDPKQAPLCVSTAKEISASGICMILREDIQVGDVLDLQINLDTGKMIGATGQVRWIKKFMITGKEKTGYEGGVEFLDAGGRIRQEISRFIIDIRRA